MFSQNELFEDINKIGRENVVMKEANVDNVDMIVVSWFENKIVKEKTIF